jgi:adenine-specific DNA-methyltransferase
MIGNPPYIEFKNLPQRDKTIIESVYITATGKYDIYIPFLELPNQLLTKNGIITYICPTRFMQRDYGKGIRKYISEKYSIRKILDFGDGQIFENAMTYTGIFSFTKGKTDQPILYKRFKVDENLQSFGNIEFVALDASETKKSTWYFNNVENEILNLISANCKKLEEVTDGIIQGIATGNDKVFIVDSKIVEDKNLELKGLQKILKGKDVSPWRLNWSNKYVIYPYDNEGKVLEENEFQEKFPNIYSYLLSKKDDLRGRPYFDKSNKLWFELWNQRSLSNFFKNKIVTLDNASKNSFALDIDNFVGTTTVYSIVPNRINLKYLVSLLNSSTLNYYHKNNTIPQAGGFYRY